MSDISKKIINVSLFHFRIEIISETESDCQKIIVYRFQNFRSLVSFVIDNLEMLVDSKYLIYYNDVILDSNPVIDS